MGFTMSNDTLPDVGPLIRSGATPSSRMKQVEQLNKTRPRTWHVLLYTRTVLETPLYGAAKPKYRGRNMSPLF